MSTKIVYQLHPDGVFVGATTADESPLEPGVFLVPYGCIEAEPPADVEGKLRAYVNGEWQYQDIPLPVDPAAPTIEEEAARALDYRNRLLGAAALRIAPLQDAVDLGMSTPVEDASLLAWKQYRVALNRIEERPGFPQSIDWPMAP